MDWVVKVGLSLLVTWLLIVIVMVVAGRRLGVARLAWLLPDLITLLRGISRDPRTPPSSRRLLVLALVWCISPIDLLPEFLPFIGPLDDALVVAFVLRHVLRRAGPDAIAEHWNGDEDSLGLILRVAGYRPD